MRSTLFSLCVDPLIAPTSSDGQATSQEEARRAGPHIALKKAISAD
jgi:hypothetical protein